MNAVEKLQATVNAAFDEADRQLAQEVRTCRRLHHLQARMELRTSSERRGALAALGEWRKAAKRGES